MQIDKSCLVFVRHIIMDQRGITTKKKKKDVGAVNKPCSSPPGYSDGFVAPGSADVALHTPHNYKQIHIHPIRYVKKMKASFRCDADAWKKMKLYENAQKNANYF